MFIHVLKYAPTDKPFQPYVSTSDEAFALLYFEGVDGNLVNWWSKKKAHLDNAGQTAHTRFELHTSPPCLRGHGIRIDSRTFFIHAHFDHHLLRSIE
jgi:hypothetical protein